MAERTKEHTTTGKRPASVRVSALVVVAVVVATLAIGAIRAFELVAPTWVSWEQRSLAADLDGDGVDEQLVLAGRTVTVSNATQGVIYTTDRAWRVSEALAGDVNDDGLPELVMLVWRRGNYGSSRPFWDQGIDLRMTQHLYVMGLSEGQIRPVWMSHELGPELQVAQMSVPSPGSVELITRQGVRSLWVWDYFGFSLAEDGLATED